MEKPINCPKSPQTDAIEELARFWDTHDLTEFEEELEEVTEPVFEHSAVMNIHLQPEEIEAVKEMAQTKGIGSEELIREWILEKIPRS
jgi:predicted DNA binding CopG/RHH family protein